MSRRNTRQDKARRRAERERQYFEAMMRVLDRELPGYSD